MNKINVGNVKPNLPVSNYNLDNEKPQILFKYFHYYEFALDSGERVMFVMVDNLFELLFIDNNHFIYMESSKRVKYKDKFDYPSCLGKINFIQSYEELEIIDIVKLMIKSYDNGEIDDLNEFVSMLKDLIKYDKELETV